MPIFERFNVLEVSFRPFCMRVCVRKPREFEKIIKNSNVYIGYFGSSAVPSNQWCWYPKYTKVCFERDERRRYAIIMTFFSERCNSSDNVDGKNLLKTFV